jgi:hypothetical protein
MKGFQFIDYMSQKNQRKNIAQIMNCTSNKNRIFSPKKHQYKKIHRNRIILLCIASTVLIIGLSALFI